MLTKEDLQAISVLLEPLRNDIRDVKEDVAVLKEDVAVLKEDVEVLKEDVEVLKEEVAVLKEDVAVLKEDVLSLQQRVEELDRRMASSELNLENVLIPNIKIVAEGHLDLSRKLNELLKAENEREMLMLRVNFLEKDVRMLKEKAV